MNLSSPDARDVEQESKNLAARPDTETRLNEHQRETAFLRHCIGYDDTAECHKLEESLILIQRHQRCVRRAVWLMALLAFMAMAGLCYRLVFMETFLNFPYFASDSVIKPLCVLGLGSVICLVAFLALGIRYRKELNRRREECRQLAARILESHLGKPRRGVAPAPQITGQPSIPSPEVVKLASEAIGVSEIQKLIDKQ